MTTFGPPSYNWSGGVDLPLQKSAHADFYRLTSADAGSGGSGASITGTTQQTGYQIAASSTWFSSVVSGGACVLPETSTPNSLSGLFLYVLNTGNNAITAYPNAADAGGSINGLSTFTIGAGTFAVLQCFAPGLWFAATGTTATTVASGSSGNVQYNNAGFFGGMSGTSWNDANRSLTIAGATVTTSNPILNLSQTWSAGGVTFTGLKLNITNTASAAGSLLMDLQVASSSKISFFADGGIALDNNKTDINGGFVSGTNGFTVQNNNQVSASLSLSGLSINGAINATIGFASGNAGSNDTTLSRLAAATWMGGGALASGTNTAATGLTLVSNLSTGNATNPDLVFQTGVKGASGTTQATATTALTLKGETQAATFAGPVTVVAGSSSSGSVLNSSSAAYLGGVFLGSDGNIIPTRGIECGLIVFSTARGVSDDTGISRSAAGVVAFGNGTAGDASSTFLAKTKAGAPTTSDVPSGTWVLIRDTSGGTTKLYYNNAGTLQSVALV